MLDGERSIQKTICIPATSVPVTPPAIAKNNSPFFCNDFILQVLADNTGIPAQNDISTVLWYFGITTTAATITIYKLVNNSWVSQTVLSTSNVTYGTFNQFGYFVNNENQSFISLQVDWSLMLAAFGIGSYKFTCSYTDSILGNGIIDSFNYVLNTYTALRADGWMRFEYWLSGITENINDNTLIKDYGTLSIYNTIRVRGYFGFPKRPYKTDTIEYDNGQEVWVEDRAEPQFICQIKMTPEFIHEIIRTDFMMADRRAITDYNSRNNHKYISQFVMKDSEYSPDYYPLQSYNSSVELKFKPETNLSRKFRI